MPTQPVPLDHQGPSPCMPVVRTEASWAYNPTVKHSSSCTVVAFPLPVIRPKDNARRLMAMQLRGKTWCTAHLQREFIESVRY